MTKTEYLRRGFNRRTAGNGISVGVPNRLRSLRKLRLNVNKYQNRPPSPIKVCPGCHHYRDIRRYGVCARCYKNKRPIQPVVKKEWLIQEGLEICPACHLEKRMQSDQMVCSDCAWVLDNYPKDLSQSRTIGVRRIVTFLYAHCVAVLISFWLLLLAFHFTAATKISWTPYWVSPCHFPNVIKQYECQMTAWQRLIA